MSKYTQKPVKIIVSSLVSGQMCCLSESGWGDVRAIKFRKKDKMETDWIPRIAELPKVVLSMNCILMKTVNLWTPRGVAVTIPVKD